MAPDGKTERQFTKLHRLALDWVANIQQGRLTKNESGLHSSPLYGGHFLIVSPSLVCPSPNGNPYVPHTFICVTEPWHML
jgi:hypothetical protein